MKHIFFTLAAALLIFSGNQSHAQQTGKVNIVITNENGETKTYNYNSGNDEDIDIKVVRTGENIKIDVEELKESIELNIGDFDKCQQGNKSYVKRQIHVNKPVMGVVINETDNGILINNVKENSGASKAGLKEGDVITHINGKSTPEIKLLREVLFDKKVGDIVEVTYNRNNRSQKTNVTLGQSRARVYAFEKNFPTRFNEKKAFLGVDISANEIGVMVDDVRPESAALKGGLLKGDIITQIGETETKTMNGLVEAISTHEPGDKVSIKINRAGQILTKNITLGERRFSMSPKFNGCGWSNMNWDELNEKITKQMEPLQFDKKVEQLDALPNTLKNNVNNDLNVGDFKVYPNPNNGNFDIQFTIAERANTQIKVNDLAGKEVFSENLPNFKGMFASKVDLGEVDSGVYFIRIISGDKIFTERIIVQ